MHYKKQQKVDTYKKYLIYFWKQEQGQDLETETSLGIIVVIDWEDKQMI
ncbi:unnamed protein product [Paramecium sonneborni]|uniref:Uncharacterized protein n=1 Tax=Paramecium sonneborni TaxID=65129 RepID=A0A8S1QRZ1_9CILI|nr:unnamed protein product [Paramecium sonneborni]